MSMSANFHNISTIQMETLILPLGTRSYPALWLADENGCYVCAHLTPGNVDQLEDALAAYREAHPRVEQKEAA